MIWSKCLDFESEFVKNFGLTVVYVVLVLSGKVVITVVVVKIVVVTGCETSYLYSNSTLVKFSQKESIFLMRHLVGRLATCTRSIPHVAAICYAHDKEHMYIHTSANSKKGKNIQKNSHVSLIVDEYLEWQDYRGILVHGRAFFHKDDSLHERAKELIYKKYPKWEKIYPITAGEPILVIKPIKILNWGLN